MRVDHGRTQVRMPEGLLDEANSLRLQVELCGKRVSQHMRVHIFVPEPGSLAPPFHHGAQGGAIDGRAPLVLRCGRICFTIHERKAKKLGCLAVAAFRAPRLPVCLLTIPPPEVSSSFLMASDHFWGATEIDENVSLTLL